MKELLELLLARLKLIPEVKTVKLFNNQLQKLSGNESMLYPAVLLEVGSVVFEGFTAGSERQNGTCLIKLHVVHQSLAQGHELAVYALKQTVHQYLHRFTGGGMFNPLVRTEEMLDLEHDSLYDYQITYTARFAEETQPLPDTTGTFLFDYQAGLTVENPA